MQEKIRFSFFILCAILSQGILAEFLEKDAEESEHLVRQKRVVDRRRGREIPLLDGDRPYVANLKENHFMHCVATILSRYTAITAARCVSRDTLQVYTVHSGAAYSNSGNVHNVTEKKMHGLSPSITSNFLQTGLALITVNPPFVYSPNTGSINLHSGVVLAGMEGVVAGWGYRVNSGPVLSNHINRLRVIQVPIMNHRECQNIYRGHFPITEEDVCTYDPQKSCADNDAGAPLIIDNQLAGIHIGGIRTRGELPIKPDVFLFLQHLNYGPWIMNNIVH